MSFPHFQQHGLMDCGATCLRMIAAYYGRIIPHELIRQKCFVSKVGVSFTSISDASEDLGFRTKAVRVNWDTLCSMILLPCIIHWNHNHFVVLYKIRKKFGKRYIYIADPSASDLLKYTEEEFLAFWTKGYNEEKSIYMRNGSVMMFEPSPCFYENDLGDSNKFNFWYILNVSSQT